MQQIAEGLWRWTALHPAWSPEDGGEGGWEAEVGCVYCEGPGAVVLIDPLVPAEPEERERFWRALDRDVERLGLPVAVLLTVFWHARSAHELVERYGAEVWAHEDAQGRFERLIVDRPFTEGHPLPGGVSAFAAARADEVVYWIPAHRALVPGDVLLGDDDGGLRLCPGSWLPEGVGQAELADALAPLLDLDVDRVLVSHGRPVLRDGRASLARALASGRADHTT